jgi:hypothetical protein
MEKKNVKSPIPDHPSKKQPKMVKGTATPDVKK